MADENPLQRVLLRDVPILGEASRTFLEAGGEATEEERRVLEEWDTACKEEMAAAEVVTAAKIALEETRRRRVDVRRRLDVIWSNPARGSE